MNPERWQRVEALFLAAVELPEKEWAAFVAGEAKGDGELYEEVMRLLRARVEPSFIEPPGSHSGERVPGPDLSGRVLGDFQLLEEVGRGGMGIVMRARQVSLDREVAVKVLPPHWTLSEKQVERFGREAHSIAKLRHPGIVSILSVGIEGDTHYFAMEYLAGRDLAAELRGLRSKTPRRPEDSTLPDSRSEGYLRAVAELCAQAADALAYAHEHGIVHRDVKPSNLLLDGSGRVKIVDFGLARDESLGTITKTTELAGTPHYMSPEQARAELHTVDHRTDVYSLGVVMYELLTLRRPFEGTTSQEILAKIVARDPEPVRKLNARVPRDLEVICGKAMAREQRDRYQSAAELRDDLQRFLSYQAIVARPPTPWERVRRSVRRHAGRYAALAGLLLIALAAMRLGQVRAASQQLSAEVDELRALEARPDWREVPFAQRIVFKDRLERLRQERERLGDADRELVARLDERFEQHLSALVADATARVAEALRSPVGIESYDNEKLVEGLLLFAEAERLFGERAGLEARAALRTPLTVRAHYPDGSPVPGEVRLRTIDPIMGLAGPSVPLGALPLEGYALHPGYYRVVVVPEREPHREFTRLVERGLASLEIEFVLDPERDVLAGMVAIEGGTMELPEAEGTTFTPYAGVPIDIEPFYIDETQVSVGEYLEYCAATGAGRPSFWKLLEGHPDDVWVELTSGAHDELPMVGVSWFEARDYAEWAGKRLVSAPERDFVGRGPEGRQFPWGAGEQEYRGNVFGKPKPPGDVASDARHYLRSAHPVRSDPETLDESGRLFHLLGNVFEHTESLGVSIGTQGYAIRPSDRLVLGAPWYALEEERVLSGRESRGVDGSYAVTEIGFRCARSRIP